MKQLLIAASLAMLLVGCATDQRASVYQSDMGQQPMRVKTGVVVDVREVNLKTKPSGGGAAIGAVSGGVLAAGDGRGGAVAGIAGAVVGGLLGNMTEEAMNTKKAIEILYMLDGGKEVLALVQQWDDANPLEKGDRIRLIENYSTTRIVRIAPPTPVPAPLPAQ